MKGDPAALLTTARAKLDAADWTPPESLKEAVLAAGEEHGLKLGKAQAPVRVAVTGRTVGLPLFESLEILGKERTLTRIDAALAKLAALSTARTTRRARKPTTAPGPFRPSRTRWFSETCRSAPWSGTSTTPSSTTRAPTAPACGAHLAAEGLPERVGRRAGSGALAEVTERHWARFGAGEIDFQDQRRDRVREFLDAGARRPDADAWFDRYLAHYESAWTLFPDTVPVLDSLRRRLPPGRALQLRPASRTASSASSASATTSRRSCAPPNSASPSPPPRPSTRPAGAGTRPRRGRLRRGPAGHRRTAAPGTPDCSESGSTARATGEDGPSGVHRITRLTELPALLRGDTRFGAPSPIG